MTQAQLVSRLDRSGSRFKGYIERSGAAPTDWRTAHENFASYASIRRNGDGSNRKVKEVDIRSADKLIFDIEKGATSLDLEICLLDPIVTRGLSGGSLTPATISTVLGLVREDGKITPLAVSPTHLLLQTDHGYRSSGNYFEKDVSSLLREALTQLSFI